MTRRRTAQTHRYRAAGRHARIARLLAAGWITHAADIPPDAIPVDPDRLNLGGSYFRPTCFQALPFTCADCGAAQVWAAEDQRWYYETCGAPCYATATRCRACRKKEQARRAAARAAAGHASPPAAA